MGGAELRSCIAGWAHRQTLLSYCIGTVNASAEEKKPSNLADERLYSPPVRVDRDRRERGWREEEVMVGQTLWAPSDCDMH